MKGNTVIDRAGLAAFLRRRRESLQPEDVGLSRGPRRRTDGLRREEVAALCHMSTDYYARLERGTGPRPSEQMIASIAQGLRVSLDERDHVFRLAGHNPPPRAERPAITSVQASCASSTASKTRPPRSSPNSARPSGRPRWGSR
jgi:transcriptional regulator with XRE-family HTH domain